MLVIVSIPSGIGCTSRTQDRFRTFLLRMSLRSPSAALRRLYRGEERGIGTEFYESGASGPRSAVGGAPRYRAISPESERLGFGFVDVPRQGTFACFETARSAS